MVETQAAVPSGNHVQLEVEAMREILTRSPRANSSSARQGHTTTTFVPLPQSLLRIAVSHLKLALRVFKLQTVLMKRT